MPRAAKLFLIKRVEGMNASGFITSNESSSSIKIMVSIIAISPDEMIILPLKIRINNYKNKSHYTVYCIVRFVT
jgi:hypothetical protein